MIGVQFENTDGSDLLLRDLIKGDIGMVECDWSGDYLHYDTANMIEVYKGGDAYDYYYYVEGGWDPDALDGEGDYYNGWVGDDNMKTEKTLAPGEAIWFKARTGDLSITTPGQVFMGGSQIICPANQFQMFAYDKPVQLDLNDASQVTFEGLIAEECDWTGDYLHYDTADMIEVYKGNDSYDFYYYVYNGWDPDALDGEGDYYTGWVGDDNCKITKLIPVSAGCWAKARKGAFTMNFK